MFNLNFRAKSPTKFRRKNCHIFQLCYTDLCSTHNIPMIFPIKAHLHKRILDFNGDRVKLDEWRPILQALSLDRSLHLVAIRSKASHSKGIVKYVEALIVWQAMWGKKKINIFPFSVLEHIDSETKSRTVNKVPVLLTNFIFRRLISSLSRCLSFNSYLKCLELDGLLLTGDYLQSLLSVSTFYFKLLQNLWILYSPHILFSYSGTWEKFFLATSFTSSMLVGRWWLSVSLQHPQEFTQHFDSWYVRMQYFCQRSLFYSKDTSGLSLF